MTEWEVTELWIEAGTLRSRKTSAVGKRDGIGLIRLSLLGVEEVSRFGGERYLAFDELLAT